MFDPMSGAQARCQIAMVGAAGADPLHRSWAMTSRYVASRGKGVSVRMIGASVMLMFSAIAGLAQQQAPAEPARALTTRLESVVKDDLDGLIQHRAIRVAVPYSRTLYFNDKGRERGISADFVRDFERWL